MKNWISAAVCMVMCARMAHGAEFHVSPKGKDSQPGTKAAPFLTLEKARDAVRGLKGKGGLPAGGVSVFLAGGEYAITNTFILKPEDSGEAGKPVTYQAAPGQRPVLTAAQVITGWKKVTGPVTGVTARAQGKLYAADVPKGWRFHYLYVNGKRQPVARWVNNDDWHNWPAYSVYDHAGIHLGTNAPLSQLPRNGDVEMCIFPAEWWNVLVSIGMVDANKGIIGFATENTVRPSKWSPGWMPHQYNLMNALCLLDEPGEWCVDTAAGRVYYWPPDGRMEKKTVSAPAAGVYQLVRFEGDPENGPSVQHVNIKGLTFRCVDRLEEAKWPGEWLKRNSENPDGAVFMMGVENCEFSGNTIMDVGACGLTMAYHVKHVKVIGNEIARTGSCGIYLYGWGAGALGLARENLICRNNIYDVGMAPYWHAAAISLCASSHNQLCHNLMRNMPYAGVSIVETMAKEVPANAGTIKHGPRDKANAYKQFRYAELPPSGGVTPETIEQYLHSDNNVVERNIVYEYMTRLNDGSAMYCWGVGTNGVWRENIVARKLDTERKDAGAAKANGFYMDDETDLALVEGNRCWGPIGKAWFDNSHGWGAKPIAEMCEHTDPMPKASANTSNRYRNNLGSVTNKPAGYDALLGQICQDVKKDGGWPGTVVLPK